MSKSTLQDQLGLRLPVIQAPMAGSQDSELALAVTNTGGLGSLPAATLSPAQLSAELDRLSREARGPWNVNFFCHQPPRPDAQREAIWRAALAPLCAEAGLSPPEGPALAARAPFDAAVADLIEPFRPPVVSFHFGLPAPELLARVKSWGSKVLSSATTVEEAQWLQDHGVDAIIAQGLEAGGHRGIFLQDDLTTQLGTFALLPQLVRAVDLPVIAAGGIADAAGVAAARALGASAVQVGTAYLLCPEARTSALHRAALQSGAVRPTALTNVFTGRPARGIVNRTMRVLGDDGTTGGCISRQAPAFPLATTHLAPLRAWAESLGRDDFTPLWAGQSYPLARVMPAAELTRALAEGWRG